MIWDEIKEPLRANCILATNKGHQTIPMHEPSDEETAHIPKAYPYPPEPTKIKEVPWEGPDGSLSLKQIEVPEDDPGVLKKHQEERLQVEELRWLAFVDASIDDGYKPAGETVEDRVKFLRSLPKMARAKLIATAKMLSEKRLSERFDEAKKD